MVDVPSSALARKRRMELLQQQRSSDGSVYADVARLQPQDDALPPKKRKVSEDESSGKALDGAMSLTKKREPKAGLAERGTSSQSAGSDDEDVEAVDTPAGRKNQLTTKKGKTQIQYDPGVPMSKEQLASWRREARRVRNRESAAASRQKIRDRIKELEGEVNEWKSKFNEAMKRIDRLEKSSS